jgi:hypothetical protein
MVPFKHRMVKVEAEVWVETVWTNFADVGVESLHGFVGLVLVINRRLSDGRHPQLHQTTLTMMLKEVCNMIAGP